MRIAVVLIVLCLMIVTGCSSKSKKSEDPSGAPQAVDTAAGPEAQTADDGGASSSETFSSPGRVVDPKYKPLSQALRSSGKSGSVQDEVAKLLSGNPSDPVALNALALIHLRKGKPGAAKLLIGRALEKSPTTPALLNNLGVALMEEGDLEGAMANFKKALQTDDRHTEALGNLGSIYAQGGDFIRALPLLEASHRQNRTHLSVANNLALALRSTKNYEGARKIYDEILKQNSKDVSALLNYAILLIDFMNKPKDGLDLVYKVKFLETERKDVLTRANALEKKARSELK